jgi:DNA polymerase-3 subunit alpha
VSVGGVVTDLQVRTTKKGGRFALLRLEDQVGGIKCVLWPETFGKFEKHLSNDTAILLTGKLETTDDGNSSIIVDEVALLDEVLQRKARGVIVRVPALGADSKNTLGDLFGLLDKHRGDCEVFVEMTLEDGVMVRVRPHGALRVRGSRDLEAALRAHGCHVEWLNVTLG